MRGFNYAIIRDEKWDSGLLGLVAAICKEAGKQEIYLRQRPEELEKLVEIAMVQNGGIREPCPSLSLSSVEGAIRKLVASGELKREGSGKNTCYYRLK